MGFQIALPAFNCTSTSTINAALQAARDIQSPVMIQFSNGGGAFLAGKGIKNDKQKAAVLGSIAGAQHTRYNFLNNFQKNCFQFNFSKNFNFFELFLQAYGKTLWHSCGSS